MKSLRFSISASILVALLCLFPRGSEAGIAELFSRATSWWQMRSVSGEISSPEQEEPDSGETVVENEGEDDEGEDDEGGQGEAAPAGSGKTPGMCIVPREPPRTICDKGSGFLCVDTPPGGVAKDSFTLHGTVDRSGAVLAGIRVSVQNEYTKRTEVVDTSDPEDGDCRGELSAGSSFCLDSNGFFAARVPLAEKGPYTISVSAARLSGEPMEKRVRTSRVTELSFGGENLSLDPDVLAGAAVDGSHITATVDLLGKCQFCDFIGATSGGVKVTVENVMTDSSGAVSRISCPTTVEQGGQGRFVVGVPVGPGKNSLTVTACNAASGEGACPQVAGIEFEARAGGGAFEIHSPPPAPAYDMTEYPLLDWEFSIGDHSSDAGGCVKVQFNREPEREVCPAADGRYRAKLEPRVGINAATVIRDGVEEHAWTFGWGKIHSPHSNGGRIDVQDALRLALPAKTVTDIILPSINNFLASDERDSMIDRFLGSPKSDEEGEGEQRETLAPEVDIPGCGAGGMGKTIIALRGKPEIGALSIDSLSFRDGGVDARAVLGDVKIGIDLFSDKDGDGKASGDPLPLVIAFRKAIAEVSLEVKGGNSGRLILVSAPNDDCSYKKKSYCKGTPAALIPKNFVGNANEWGGFVSCDVAAAAGGAVDACKALNSLNAQTGIVAEGVLDAINSAIYCAGSTALTGAGREGFSIGEFEIGCADEGGCEGTIAGILPHLFLPLSARLGDNILIGESGVLISADLAAGDEQIYEETPARFKIPQAGMISGEMVGAKPFGSPKDHAGDVAASLTLDAAGAVFFVAATQGDGRLSKGLLDFDIDDDFFAELGFNFVEQCDKFVAAPGGEESAPTICFVRPRVIELLGPPLTNYGYFEAKQPLMLSIRGNRALSPRVSLRALEELPQVARDEGEDAGYLPAGDLVEVELGGLNLSFYALEVDDSIPADEFGNLPLKRDSQGKPVIKPMRPGVFDPRDGQIVSFDLTLMLALEISRSEGDLVSGGESSLALRILPDRSRLIVTPVEGSNATTVPAAGLISSLTEKIKLALTSIGTREDPVLIPLPSEFDPGGEGEGASSGILGFERIEFGPEGITLGFDQKTNSISLALSAVITQLLHVDGEVVRYRIPDSSSDSSSK